MSETVIVALLALLGTLGGSFGGIITSNKLTSYRLEQLEKKVAVHNGIIDRTYKLEQHATLIDEKLTVANHRIEDLERDAS